MTAAGIRYEYRTRTALRVFDPVDSFARNRGLAGARPRPIGAVQVYLLADRTPGAERNFDVPPELVLARDPDGYAISYGRLRTPDGGVRATRFLGGPYLLRVRSTYYQVADFDGVRLPATADQPEPYELVLSPAYTYPFPTATTPPMVKLDDTGATALTLLRGAVLAPDRRGIPDARVTAPTAMPYRTDQDGQWVLVFTEGVPPSAQVDVTIAVPGANPVVLPGVPVDPGGTATLAQTALRGRILAPGANPGSATVLVEGTPGAAGVRADGAWNYCFPIDQPAGSVSVTATLPDGRSLNARDVPVTPRHTTTVPDFSFPRSHHGLRSSDA